MGLSGCYALMKYLVVVVNFIFWVVGIATVGLSIWMFFDPTFYVSMTQDSNNYFISTCILFAAGVLLVIVAFLGCCGSFKESQCMLITFFSLLLVILVAQIAAGIWAYVNADSLEDLVRSSVKNTVQEEYYNIDSRKTTFDAFQKGLQCCGADKPADWIGSQKVLLGISADPIEFNIPESCCRENADEASCVKATRNIKVGAQIDTKVIYQEGCYKKVVDAIKHNANIIFGVGLAIIIMEIIGLILALVLAFAINKNRRYKA